MVADIASTMSLGPHLGFRSLVHNIRSTSFDFLIPREIYDKFAILNYSTARVYVPEYMYDFQKVIGLSDKYHVDFRKNLSRSLHDLLLTYKNEYEFLLNYDLDFGKVLNMRYLRNKFVNRWNAALVEFALKHPDTDPLAISKFNAIIVQSQNSKDLQ
jgi:hypothetical protein